MSLDINQIFSLISFIFAMASIVFEIIIIKRLEGKLKWALVFMTFVVAIIAVRDSTSFLGLVIPQYATSLIRITTTILIFFAVICIYRMIKRIDGHYMFDKGRHSSKKK